MGACNEKRLYRTEEESKCGVYELPKILSKYGQQTVVYVKNNELTAGRNS